MMTSYRRIWLLFCVLLSVPARPEPVGPSMQDQCVKEQLECVKKCESVMEAMEGEISSLGVVVETCQAQRQEYNELLDEKNEELARPRRNPVFMGAMGAAVGAVITAIIIGVTAR